MGLLLPNIREQQFVYGIKNMNSKPCFKVLLYSVKSFVLESALYKSNPKSNARKIIINDITVFLRIELINKCHNGYVLAYEIRYNIILSGL